MLQTKSVVPDDVLRYAVAHGMIDLSYVQEQIEMNKRKELLDTIIQVFTDMQAFRMSETGSVK